MIHDSSSVLKTIRSILAADCACEEKCFQDDGIFIVQAKLMPGARRFPLSKKALNIMTMGSGVVISCSSDRMQWVTENFSSLSRIDLFYIPAVAKMQECVARDNQVMIGPELKYICTQDTFRPYTPSDKVTISTVGEEQIQELYQGNRFPNALHRGPVPERPIALASVARDSGRAIGVAAATKDHDEMWQIGIDVEPDYQNRGIGQFLVSEATDAVLKMGKLPYYMTAAANIASRRIAIALGYRPTWLELYAKDNTSLA